MVSHGNSRQGGMSGPVWMLLGIVIGSVGTFGGLKVLHHGAKSAAKGEEKTLPMVQAPSTGGVIQFTAEPQQKGVVLASSSPLKLTANGDSKLAREEAGKVFTGFRSWTGTASYLNSGQGEFIVKTASGAAIDTGWKASDYQDFVKGGALQLRAEPGQAYTIFFQRKGRGAISLGTVELGAGGAKSSASAPVAAGDDKSDGALSTP